MKAAPDRCRISLRPSDADLLLNAIACVRERAPFSPSADGDRHREEWEREASALEERLKSARHAAEIRGRAARIEHDLGGSR